MAGLRSHRLGYLLGIDGALFLAHARRTRRSSLMRSGRISGTGKRSSHQHHFRALPAVREVVRTFLIVGKLEDFQRSVAGVISASLGSGSWPRTETDRFQSAGFTIARNEAMCTCMMSTLSPWSIKTSLLVTRAV